MKNFADLIREEASKFDNIVYCNKPYSCAIEEALSYFKSFKMPKQDDYIIDRNGKTTTIELKPMKGSRKRKNYTIVLWTT